MGRGPGQRAGGVDEQGERGGAAHEGGDGPGPPGVGDGLDRDGQEGAAGQAACEDRAQRERLGQSGCAEGDGRGLGEPVRGEETGE